MKKYFPLLALLLYAGLGFRFPEAPNLASLQAHALTALEQLGEVSDKVRPVIADFAESIPDGDAGVLLNRIEEAALAENVHFCNALEPIPAFNGAPLIGDWVAYCLSRVRGDRDRCEQISATLKPDLKNLCIEKP